MVAMSLAACGGSPTTTTTTGTPAVPVAGVPASPVTNVSGTSDTLSPTQTVTPGQPFPTDKTTVPASVLKALATKKPLLVMWVDPTTKVAKDQRREVNAIIKRNKGTIRLVALNYTKDDAPSTTATLPVETQKIELLASSLQLNTTPYILFVDRFGRITYRLAGFADRELLQREVLRATE
jgi:hypothetical protein